jgi:hypothetical protein
MRPISKFKSRKIYECRIVSPNYTAFYISSYCEVGSRALIWFIIRKYNLVHTISVGLATAFQVGSSSSTTDKNCNDRPGHNLHKPSH